MTSIQRTAYPRFKSPVSERELGILYEPIPDELAFAKANTRTGRGQLTLLVLLKCYQRLGYLPPASDVPDQVIGYLASYIDGDVVSELGERRRQARHRYREAIRGFSDTHESAP